MHLPAYLDFPDRFPRAAHLERLRAIETYRHAATMEDWIWCSKEWFRLGGDEAALGRCVDRVMAAAQGTQQVCTGLRAVWRIDPQPGSFEERVEKYRPFAVRAQAQAASLEDWLDCAGAWRCLGYGKRFRKEIHHCLVQADAQAKTPGDLEWIEATRRWCRS